jgi:Glycosyltransferase Family 4
MKVKRLSIVHTESSLEWTDQQVRILAEAEGLIRRHDVKLLCPPESAIHAEAGRRGVPAIALPIARKRPVGVKVLYEWFKRNRCDVVCAHGSTDAWLVALALLALGRPFPMVYAPHVSPPPPTNVATRWLYTRAAKRVVSHSDAPEKELAERMEKIYLQVRR